MSTLDQQYHIEPIENPRKRCAKHPTITASYARYNKNDGSIDKSSKKLMCEECASETVQKIQAAEQERQEAVAKAEAWLRERNTIANAEVRIKESKSELSGSQIVGLMGTLADFVPNN